MDGTCRAQLLEDLSQHGIDEATAVDIAERRGQFEVRYGVWKELNEHYVAPMVAQAVQAVRKSSAMLLDHDAFPFMGGVEDEDEIQSDEERGNSSADEGGGTASISTKGKKRAWRGRVPEQARDQTTEWQEVAGTRIHLPSKYVSAILSETCMASLVQVEKELRKGRANDALDNLRTHLITSYGFKRERRNVSGQKANTRALGKIRRKERAVEKAAAVYRRVRRGLV